MNFSSLAAVVLCAGKGTRMKSDSAFGKAKVLHPLLGKPMCWYPIARARELGASNVVPIVGHQAEQVTHVLDAAFPGMSFALQAEQRGTGHAVQCAEAALLGFQGAVMILSGDVPLLTKATLERLISAYREGTGPLALVSFRPPDATGYGRLVREPMRDGPGASNASAAGLRRNPGGPGEPEHGGKLKRIVEHKDASAEERKIGECNAGIYLADAAFLFASVKKLSPKNAQGELYLTDIVAMAGDIAVVEADAEEIAGINDRAQLAACTKVLQRRINQRHMDAGVTMLAPETAWIDEGVTIGQDTVLGPNVTLADGTKVGAGVSIGQGCVLTKSVVGDGVELKPYSVLEEAQVGSKGIIGPFSRLRPGTELAEGVHLGNFVETKKAKIGKGSKANHLAYLGDAVIGEGTNVGAGVITCNYDGVNKHLTTIGDRVFVGTDSQLVAPVTLGNDVYVGAGTTVTDDVPAGALALSRAPQTIKEGWTERRRKLLADMKKR